MPKRSNKPECIFSGMVVYEIYNENLTNDWHPKKFNAEMFINLA